MTKILKDTQLPHITARLKLLFFFFFFTSDSQLLPRQWGQHVQSSGGVGHRSLEEPSRPGSSPAGSHGCSSWSHAGPVLQPAVQRQPDVASSTWERSVGDVMVKRPTFGQQSEEELTFVWNWFKNRALWLFFSLLYPFKCCLLLSVWEVKLVLNVYYFSGSVGAGFYHIRCVDV